MTQSRSIGIRLMRGKIPSERWRYRPNFAEFDFLKLSEKGF